MVLKPSEIAPISGMLFAEIIHEAGFPAGVFNLINGDGVGVGTQLSSHPEIDMISFTGSTRAGKLISKNAADTIKRVCLELGGKGANIVLLMRMKRRYKEEFGAYLIIQANPVMHPQGCLSKSQFTKKLLVKLSK